MIWLGWIWFGLVFIVQKDVFPMGCKKVTLRFLATPNSGLDQLDIHKKAIKGIKGRYIITLVVQPTMSLLPVF